jgi:hypothetical protein
MVAEEETAGQIGCLAQLFLINATGREGMYRIPR